MLSGRLGGDRQVRGQAEHLGHVIREELDSIHPVMLLGGLMARAIPKYAGNRLRTAILRRVGWDIGRHSTLGGVPTFCGRGSFQRLLSIGERTWVNVGCLFELHDEIRIGDGVAIGHDVMFLTSSHQIGHHDWRAGEKTTGPITVGSGVWIGARSVILPGVTVGAGAVIAAGSIVNKDVDPDTLVGGVPAKMMRSLPD